MPLLWVSRRRLARCVSFVYFDPRATQDRVQVDILPFSEADAEQVNVTAVPDAVGSSISINFEFRLGALG
jgi:hypothetical protein